MNEGNSDGDGAPKREREESLSPVTPQSRKKPNTMSSPQPAPPKSELQLVVDTISQSMAEMKTEFGNHLKELNESIESKFGTWQQERAEILQKQTDLENRIDQLERQQKRNNIVITGLDRVTGDTRNVKAVANELFNKQLKQTVSCVEAFQLTTKNGQSKIIAKMGSLEDKLCVMKNSRDLNRDGRNIFLSDDLIKKDQLMMFKARKFRNQMKAENKEAKIGSASIR